MAGYYGTFPIDQQPRIEELVRARWGRGRYLFQIRNADGKTVSSWPRTLAGGPPLDSEGNPITGAITFNQDQTTMSAGPLATRGDSPLNSDGWLHLLHNRERELRDVRTHLEAQRDYYEKLVNELRERVEKEKEARIKAENERDRERDRATFEGLRAQVDALRTGHSSPGADPLDMVTKIMALMPKPRETGIGELRDIIALSRELSDKGEDGDLSQLARVFGEFFRAKQGEDEPEEAPPAKAPAPAVPSGPVATQALKGLLETGLDELPEVETWARAALPTLTAGGRARLTKITKLSELLGWAERIPGIALPALVNAIKSDANRLKWFFAAIDAVQKELR